MQEDVEKCVDTLVRSLGSLCILNESNVVCGNDCDFKGGDPVAIFDSTLINNDGSSYVAVYGLDPIAFPSRTTNICKDVLKTEK